MLGRIREAAVFVALEGVPVIGAKTAAVCHICQRQHVYDRRDGWYNGSGKERHPFTPAPPREQVRVEHPVDREGAPVNESVLFGALEKCGRCAAVLDHGDRTRHDNWHVELEDALGNKRGRVA